MGIRSYKKKRVAKDKMPLSSTSGMRSRMEILLASCGQDVLDSPVARKLRPRSIFSEVVGSSSASSSVGKGGHYHNDYLGMLSEDILGRIFNKSGMVLIGMRVSKALRASILRVYMGTIHLHFLSAGVKYNREEDALASHVAHYLSLFSQLNVEIQVAADVPIGVLSGLEVAFSKGFLPKMVGLTLETMWVKESALVSGLLNAKKNLLWFQLEGKNVEMDCEILRVENGASTLAAILPALSDCGKLREVHFGAHVLDGDVGADLQRFLWKCKDLKGFSLWDPFRNVSARRLCKATWDSVLHYGTILSYIGLCDLVVQNAGQFDMLMRQCKTVVCGYVRLEPLVLECLTRRLQALYDAPEFQSGQVMPFAEKRKRVTGGCGFVTEGVLMKGSHSLRVKRMEIPMSEFFWFPQFVQAAQAVGLEVTVGEVKVYKLGAIETDPLTFADFYGV